MTHKQEQEKNTRRTIHAALKKQFGNCEILDTIEDSGGWFQIVVQVPYEEEEK